MDPSQLSPEQQQEMLMRVRQEVQSASIQALVESVSEKCFEKCVAKSPNPQLSSSDQKCMAMCVDRYLEVVNVVGQALSEQQ